MYTQLEMNLGIEKTRRCSVCGQVFPATEEYFYKHGKDRRGRQWFFHWCKKCHTAKTAPNAQKWNNEHPERAKEIQARYRARTKEMKTDAYLRRKKRTVENLRIWKQNHPEKARFMVQAKRHKRRAISGKLTTRDVERHYELQKGRCWYCQAELNGQYHIDHRVPISRGGTNDPSNIVLACPACNMSKGAKLPHEWNGRLL